MARIPDRIVANRPVAMWASMGMVLIMKHHQHSRGWRQSNRFDLPVWREIAGIAACYVAVIGLMALVVELLCK